MAGLIRHSLKRIVPTVTPNVTQKATVVSSPPKYSIPMAEKLGLGGFMCATILGPMFYIIANVKYYKNPGGMAGDLPESE